MPRVSVKENKNAYFQRREELGLTRETASELLGAGGISLERLGNRCLALSQYSPSKLG